MTMRTGQTFGRFHILGHLVTENEAIVYRAYDPSQDRHLALMVLPIKPAGAGGDPKGRLRLAQKLLELKHPHIVRIDAAGLEGDHLYLESPLVEATTLAERLTHGPLAVPEAARYFGQIVSAIELAHSRGVHHLALRPVHILLDGYGNALLSNFGVALMEVEGTGDGRPRVRGELHCAPEQDRGAEGESRADQYALGALLFRMLTGYTTSNPGMPVSELIRRMNERTARLATGPRPIPRAIAAVIAKATSWEPTDRYRSVRELHQALDQAAASILETRARLRPEGEPTRAPASPVILPPVPNELEKPPVRRFWVPIGVLAVVLAVVLGRFALVSAGLVGSLGNRVTEPAPVQGIESSQLTAMAGTIEALSTRVNSAALGETTSTAIGAELTSTALKTPSPTPSPVLASEQPGLTPMGSPTAPGAGTPAAGPTATSAPNPGGATQPPPDPTQPPAAPTNTWPAPTNPPPPTNTPVPPTNPPPPTNTPVPPTNPPPPTNTPLLPLPTVTLPFP